MFLLSVSFLHYNERDFSLKKNMEDNFGNSDLKVHVGFWVFLIVHCFKPLVKLNTFTSVAA
jgi:hypothetical protein